MPLFEVDVDALPKPDGSRLLTVTADLRGPNWGEPLVRVAEFKLAADQVEGFGAFLGCFVCPSRISVTFTEPESK